MNLFHELVQLLDLIKPHRYLLVGGLAYAIYARPRFTQDIDILIAENDFYDIFQALTKEGFLKQPNIMEFQHAKIARCVRMSDLNALIVDFLLETEKAFNVFFEKKNIIEYRDITINVIDLRSLILLKQKRNSKQDQLDIDELDSLTGQYEN